MIDDFPKNTTAKPIRNKENLNTYGFSSSVLIGRRAPDADGAEPIKQTVLTLSNEPKEPLPTQSEATEPRILDISHSCFALSVFSL